MAQAINRYRADLRDFRFLFFEQFDLPSLLGKEPFKEWGTEECYAQLDGWYRKLCEIEAAAESLRAREHLFDVRVHPWRELGACRQELLHLKLVWDHAGLVEQIAHQLHVLGTADLRQHQGIGRLTHTGHRRQVVDASQGVGTVHP